MVPGLFSGVSDIPLNLKVSVSSAVRARLFFPLSGTLTTFRDRTFTFIFRTRNARPRSPIHHHAF